MEIQAKNTRFVILLQYDLGVILTVFLNSLDRVSYVFQIHFMALNAIDKIMDGN